MLNQPGADLLPLLYYLFISSLVCLLIYSLVDLFIGSLVLSFINLSWLGVGMGWAMLWMVWIRMGVVGPSGGKAFIHSHRTLKAPHPVRSAKLTRVPLS
jgi:hypothetical protein